MNFLGGSDTSRIPHGKPYAGKLHVRFDEGYPPINGEARFEGSRRPSGRTRRRAFRHASGAAADESAGGINVRAAGLHVLPVRKRPPPIPHVVVQTPRGEVVVAVVLKHELADIPLPAVPAAVAVPEVVVGRDKPVHRGPARDPVHNAFDQASPEIREEPVEGSGPQWLGLRLGIPLLRITWPLLRPHWEPFRPKSSNESGPIEILSKISKTKKRGGWPRLSHFSQRLGGALQPPQPLRGIAITPYSIGSARGQAICILEVFLPPRRPSKSFCKSQLLKASHKLLLFRELCYFCRDKWQYSNNCSNYTYSRCF